jgi:hypothetical protein
MGLGDMKNNFLLIWLLLCIMSVLLMGAYGILLFIPLLYILSGILDE